MKERRIARCLGEENLARAIEGMTEEGFDIEHVLFAGFSHQSVLQTSETLARYIVIGCREARTN